jgi:hypothetical protein
VEDEMTPQEFSRRACDIERLALQMGFAVLSRSGAGRPLDIDAMRSEFALPVVAGLIHAAAQFAWLTGLPDGTAGDLLATLMDNAEVAMHRAVRGDMPAGEYWVTVAAALAREGGERG